MLAAQLRKKQRVYIRKVRAIFRQIFSTFAEAGAENSEIFYEGISEDDVETLCRELPDEVMCHYAYTFTLLLCPMYLCDYTYY
jgi:hypothetical protein